MSYVIQVWEKPVPATFEEAEEIVERLLGKAAGRASSRLTRFVAALWAAWPRDLETDPADPVWTDTFAKQGREPTPIETLGIATSHLDAVMPFIVKTAAENGLVLYDEQQGTLWLPDGRTLGLPPPVAAAAPAKPPSKPWEAREFYDPRIARLRLLEFFTPFMKTHGFKWKKLAWGPTFVRTFPGGEQKVAPVIDNVGGSTGMELVLVTHLFAVDDFVQQFRQFHDPRPADVLSGVLLDWLAARGDLRADALYTRRTNRSWIPMHMAKWMDPNLERLEQILPDMFEEMKAFETPEGLWRMAVDEAQGRRRAHFKESIPAKLVAGALLGAPDTLIAEVHAQEIRRYEADLARRREGARESTLTMLVDEEVRVRADLERLLGFVRTEVSPR